MMASSSSLCWIQHRVVVVPSSLSPHFPPRKTDPTKVKSTARMLEIDDRLECSRMDEGATLPTAQAGFQIFSRIFLQAQGASPATVVL